MTQQRTPGHAPGLTVRSALARLPNSRLEQTAELGLGVVRDYDEGSTAMRGAPRPSHSSTG